MTAKIFSLDEVSKHKTKSDLWVIIHNKVYDITHFIAEVKKRKKEQKKPPFY
jgi:cytochrome b involved in lipid metabolism